MGRRKYLTAMMMSSKISDIMFDNKTCTSRSIAALVALTRESVEKPAGSWHTDRSCVCA